MGWWKVENTEDILGDEPLDAIDRAITAIVAQYSSALGRLPTKTEWEILLTMGLHRTDTDQRSEVVHGQKVIGVIVDLQKDE